jgi:hypothetical protein
MSQGLLLQIFYSHNFPLRAENSYKYFCRPIEAKMRDLGSKIEDRLTSGRTIASSSLRPGFESCHCYWNWERENGEKMELKGWKLVEAFT